MLRLGSILILLLPLFHLGTMADVVIKGPQKEVILSGSDFQRLFPGVTADDSLSKSKFIVYGLELTAAIEEGFDTLAVFEGISNDISNDIIVSEWISRKTEDRLKDFDFNQCFIENRSKFKWSKPRFKGLIIVGLNDSVVMKGASLIRDMELVDLYEVRREVMKELGKEVSVLSLLVEQGRNPLVDMIVFGEQVDLSELKWKTGKVITGEILTSPENWLDVKDEVISLAINEIHQEIERELKEKYIVEIIDN